MTNKNDDRGADGPDHRSRNHRSPGDCTLGDLRIGDQAEIIGYAPAHRGYRSKLLSMGLTRGTRLTVRNIAPLGDPIQIGVRDFELSLRADEAAALRLVRVGPEELPRMGRGRRRWGRGWRRRERQHEC